MTDSHSFNNEELNGPFPEPPINISNTHLDGDTEDKLRDYIEALEKKYQHLDWQFQQCSKELAELKKAKLDDTDDIIRACLNPENFFTWTAYRVMKNYVEKTQKVIKLAKQYKVDCSLDPFEKDIKIATINLRILSQRQGRENMFKALEELEG